MPGAGALPIAGAGAPLGRRCRTEALFGPTQDGGGGASCATIIMKSTRSAHVFAILREDIKTRAIGIEQQGRHHARIERRLTKPAFVACDDLRHIQVLTRQSDDELRQMVRRPPCTPRSPKSCNTGRAGYSARNRSRGN
jgi:hypothetical protein